MGNEVEPMKAIILCVMLAASSAWASGTNFLASNVANALTIDGNIQIPLRLVRGATYHFDVFVSVSYQFLLTTSSSGGSTAGMVTNGVVGFQPLFDGDLYFTPNTSTPDVIYYQSPLNSNFGGPIYVSDPPEIVRITTTNGLQVALANVTAGTAVVDRATALAPNLWTPVATNASGLTNMLLTLPPADPNAFYRVRMAVP
jgi:hypothetical protein